MKAGGAGYSRERGIPVSDLRLDAGADDGDGFVDRHASELITSRCDAQAKLHIKMEYGIAISEGMTRTPNDRREILRRFMQDRGLTAAKWSKDAKVSTNSIYNFLNGESEALSAMTYGKLARAVGVPSWKISGDEPEPPSPTVVNVVGFVEAGVWQEAVEWDRTDWREIDVPISPRFRGKAKALEVRGRSMEMLYPPGSIVVWVATMDFRPAKADDKVIVYRKHRDGRCEATVKEYREENGQTWLWPRSFDPAHQAPISLANPGEQIRDVEIIGIVVGSYRPEEGI